MDDEQDPLTSALTQHAIKLCGMGKGVVRQAAADGKRLIVVARANATLTTGMLAIGDAELLLASGDHSIWACAASEKRLLRWLLDDDVVAIGEDELPDVMLDRLDPERAGWQESLF